MPSFRALSIFFAVAVSVAAATSLVVPSSDTLCGNGAVCFASETCVSQVKNSGHKYACAPFSNAHVCSDSRFSCPANSVCNYANRSCDSPQGKNDMAINRNGHLAAGASKPTPNDGLCAYLADIIPSFCTCAQDQTGTQAQISCQVNFVDVDTIGLIVTLLPCINPASVSIEVTEADLSIDYLVGNFSAGTNEDIPIPGLDVDIPIIGSVGVNAVVQVDGDAQELDFNLGLDGCITILGYTKCGADLTSSLPIWVLNGSITLSDLCGGKTVSTVAPKAAMTKSAKANGDGCCGAQCDSSSDCTDGLFCCPNHNECMDTTTEGTCGPNCQACGGDPCGSTSNWAQKFKKCSKKAAAPHH